MKTIPLVAVLLTSFLILGYPDEAYAISQSELTAHRAEYQSSGTCQAFVPDAHPMSQAVVIGDSIINVSPMENELSSELAAIGISISSVGFAYTISGWGMEDALAVLNAGTLDADITSSDVFILNLGVNNWNEARDDLAQVQGWADQLIASVQNLNPNIVIVWIEPHAVASLTSNPNVAPYTLLIADYLNTKDAAGDICLVDWSSYADANPETYTMLTGSQGQPLPPDGVHIYGHHEEYVGLMIDTVEQVISLNPPLPGIINQLAPSGSITDTMPTLSWVPEPVAEEYTIVVYDIINDAIVYSSPTPILPSVCTGNTSADTCSVTLSYVFGPGNYAWLIRASNSSGAGLWSIFP